MILAGDIGGTKTNLAVFARQADRLVLVRQRSVPSQHSSSLEAILTEFLAGHAETLRGACFGIAGPVVDGRCHATNLPWIVDVRALQHTLGVRAVSLINDLEATGYGIQTLPEESI